MMQIANSIQKTLVLYMSRGLLSFLLIHVTLLQENVKCLCGVFEALVFSVDEDSLNNETIPRYVSYKIRMDIDRVDSTRKYKVKDRCVNCAAYICFSFLYSLWEALGSNLDDCR